MGPLTEKLGHRILELQELAKQSDDIPSTGFKCPRPYLPRRRPRRVYHGILIGDYHLDMLEALLYEIGDLVHKLIVVEADHTHQGEPRAWLLPSFLGPNGRFGMFRDKIVDHYIRLDVEVCRQDAWKCEAQHRDAILDVAARAGMKPGRDVLISGDADEIPSRTTMRLASRCNYGNKPVILVMPFHVYGLMWQWSDWDQLLVANAEYWLRKGVSALSTARFLDPKPFDRIDGPDTGWHLSYFGGVHAVRRKLLRFAHSEFNQPPYTDLEYIRQNIRDGRQPQRKGPLVGSVNLFRPRILRLHRRFQCWIDPLRDELCFTDFVVDIDGQTARSAAYFTSDSLPQGALGGTEHNTSAYRILRSYK